MRKILLIPLIIIVFLLLCSCEVITSGEVFEKTFKPAQTVSTIVPYVIYDGKNSTTMYLPYTYYYPDRYIIKIKKFSSANNKWLTADYYIDKDLYEKINIGDEYEYRKDIDINEEPYTREKTK